ncbi:MAG TPA: ATPase, T2SS/T4P/T4SS family [Bacteroidales bacterium]|nr:ATPase, T2SS/T4P/T4SS family [Bacteroidales bacterium]
MDEPAMDLKTDLIQTITPEQAWHYSILPKSKGNDVLEFFHADRNDLAKIEELEMLFGKRVVFHEVSIQMIKKHLSKYYLRNKDTSRHTNGQNKAIEGSSLKPNDFLLHLLEEANNLLCSDIHIESYESLSRIRFRIDGKLIERFIIRRDEYPALINKIKILANLDIAEKRLPQDGRILLKSEEQTYDIRVSIIPSIFGEKIVLRLLRKTASNINIRELGFDQNQFITFVEGLKKPNGIILISGPTGSGKTTTLYASLNILNKTDINILTIEDPIEYTIEGINQVQLREDIGLTFAKALKTFLRQDPDIIMLGEIRDSETAQMAIRAALTGHLVLSTIHTNSAWGIVSRLIDMGIPPFLLSSTLNMVVSQRLIRKLCPLCKREMSFDHKLFPIHVAPENRPITHFIPVGCEHCHNTGFNGRIAVYEIINIDQDMREMIRHSIDDANQKLKEKKIKQLYSSALDYFLQGVTSLEEIAPILESNF